MLAVAWEITDNTIMKKMDLERIVSELPSHEAYHETHGALQRASEHVPSHFDKDNLEHLRAQTAYLESANEAAPHSLQLKVEVAEAKDAIPLPYRLGLLSALSRGAEDPETDPH